MQLRKIFFLVSVLLCLSIKSLDTALDSGLKKRENDVCSEDARNELIGNVNTKSVRKKYSKKDFYIKFRTLTKREKIDFIQYIAEHSGHLDQSPLELLERFLYADAQADPSWISQIRQLKLIEGLKEEEELFLSTPIVNQEVLSGIRKVIMGEEFTVSVKKFKIKHKFLPLSDATALSLYTSRPDVIYGNTKIDFKKKQVSKVVYNISCLPVTEECIREIFNGNNFLNCNHINCSSDTKQIIAKLIDAKKLTIKHVLMAIESRYSNSPLDKQRALRAIFFNAPDVINRLENLGLIPEGQPLIGPKRFQRHAKKVCDVVAGFSVNVGL